MREMGIRIALGAQKHELTRLFISRGLALVMIGVACGVACAAATTGVFRSLLFDVSPFDPLTYATVSIGLVVAAALATYIPASRASRIDPIDALRAD